MTRRPVQSNAYPLTFTAASLRPDLARIVAETYLQTRDWAQAKRQILQGNLLQARSPLSAKRMEIELRHRLQTLTVPQLEVLAHSHAEGRRAMAWLAAIKHSPFLREFATGVLRAKLAQIDPVLRPSDYETFFIGQSLAHPKLNDLTASSKYKIQWAAVKMLREAGILPVDDSDFTISRPLLPPEALDAIRDDDPAWLAGFLVPEDEITLERTP